MKQSLLLMIMKKRHHNEEQKRATRLKFADAFTLTNASLGMLAIIASIQGNLNIAALCLVLACVADLLDGKVARWMGTSSKLGIELDSLADMISFGVAPAIFGFVQLQSKSFPVLFVIVLLFYVCTGLVRLGRFNVQVTKGYYLGMPITTNGLIFPLLHFLSVDPAHWVWVYLLSAILMVSPFKIKKFL